MIYTTGDSHAQWTFHSIPGVQVHSISMLTMRRVGHLEDRLIPNVVAQMGLTTADTLILCLGEIDIRCHAKPILERTGVAVDELLGGWVSSYLNRATTLDLNGARLAIMGVVPPIPEGEILYAGEVLPVAGSNEERVAYTRAMNRLLAEACAARGLIYLDVYTPYADERGLLKPECSDGSVHIARNAYVRALLQRLGLLD